MLTAIALSACGGGEDTGSGPAGLSRSDTTLADERRSASARSVPIAATTKPAFIAPGFRRAPPSGEPPTAGSMPVPLYPEGTEFIEQLQYREPDGTLVTFMGMRPVERHARERGEGWFAPDAGPGRYLTFPTFYFQNRTFGLEIRDTVPAGGNRIEFSLRVNQGTFDGTTFSLFRNILNPDVRDFGWSANTGFNNPTEGNRPICHAGQPRENCMVVVQSNWRTSPHSPLRIGDKIELAPAPRLLRDAQGNAMADGGGSRYYSFEQLYVVGHGVRPWYGIAPNLDSEPLPEHTLLGGQTSVSYNYSEEPMRMFQQMANNIGVVNAQRFAEGRRLFHTSFADGRHSEHPNVNPVFTQHVGQLGPRFNQSTCIGCHAGNGRSPVRPLGERLDTMSVLTGTADPTGARQPDPNHGLSILQRRADASQSDLGAYVAREETTIRTLHDGEQIALRRPVYGFHGLAPEHFSVRQAPQVIGLGLLEAVAESTILGLADPNDINGDGVRGIPNLVTDPETGVDRLGRFGWKATMPSIRHQSANALMSDMGVTTRIYPSRACQQGSADCRASGGLVSVSNAELERLAQYLSLLGVPAQRSVPSGYPAGMRVASEHVMNPAAIQRGRVLFAQVRCTACHVPELRTGQTHPLAELRNQLIRPYSNLLLHDMGPGLADNVAEGLASGAMWRTAPLWGLGSLKFVQGGEANVRYLHDGRARTLMEAIGWHGGEADGARQRFEALGREDRQAVLQFLESL